MKKTAKNLHNTKKCITFAAFKLQVGRKEVAQQGGIFYATDFRVKAIAAPRGQVDNTPKALPTCKPEQRVVLHIF